MGMGLKVNATLAAAALLIGGQIPASAQDRTFAGSKIIKAISESDLFAALDHNGATYSADQNSDTRYNVTFESGNTAVIARAGCTEQECLGVLMIAFFTPPKGVSPSDLDERVRLFNISYNPASALRNDNGSYVLKNYVIADDGITLGNLARTLSLFEDMVGVFSEDFYAED